METDTRVDRIVIGAAAIGASGALLPLIFTSQDFNYMDGSPGYRMTLGACYALAGIYSVIHFREILAIAARSKALILLLALAFVSAAWAESPGLVIQRAIALFGTTLIGLLLAARFTGTERLRLLSIIFRCLAMGSFFISVFLPRFGISDDPLHTGDWVGVFGNKNKLGAYIATAMLIDYFRPMRLRWKLLWFGLYILLLVKSGSASPLAALFATWVVLRVAQTLRGRHRLSIRAILISVAATVGFGVAAGLGTGVFQFIFGRTADLSGRTGLWKALIPAIAKHPLLGYGYGSFWGGASAEYYAVVNRLYWVPMYSHNGYVEITVNLGLVGLILASIFLLSGTRYAVQEAELSTLERDAFPIAYLIYFLIRNMTECTILYLNSLEWALCVAVVVSVLPAVQLAGRMAIGSLRHSLSSGSAPGGEYAG